MRFCPDCHAWLSADQDFCAVCVTELDGDVPTGIRALYARPPNWVPRRPVLSVAASIVLFWAAAHRVDVGEFALVSAVFFVPAAVLIVPRVRLVVGRLLGAQPTEPDVLTELAVVGSVVVLYALLVGSALVALYAGAGRGTFVPGSRFAAVQAYAAALLLVRGLRTVRRRLDE